jgi:putative DNA primase/helicase
MSEAIEQFRDAIRAAGLNPPDTIHADSKIHRFATNGKAKDDAGWYVLFEDGCGGVFGDFRTDLRETWQAERVKSLSSSEREALKQRCDREHQKREAEDARRKIKAREKAAVIWKATISAPDDHDYLRRKGIKSHGLRIHDGALTIPVTDGSQVHSLQFIRPDGEKRFLTGGRVAGCYFAIGNFESATMLMHCRGIRHRRDDSRSNGLPCRRGVQCRKPQACGRSAPREILQCSVDHMRR